MAVKRVLCLITIMAMVAVSHSSALHRRTIITNKPEDLKVAVGSSATFRCTPDTDPDVTTVVYWEFKGAPVNLKDSRIQFLNDYSLCITATVSQDSGPYVCVVKTPYDEARAQAMLSVQDKPNPPALDGIECKEKYAVIHWHSTGDNLASIRRFTVEYSTMFNPDDWALAIVVPGMESSCNVMLSPGANHTLRVIAQNDIGSSAPSERSEVCSTMPDVPYMNPNDVKASGTHPHNMVISWRIMPQIEHNGPGFHYEVGYKRDGPGEIWVVDTITDWRQNQLIVSNTPTFTRYAIKVVAVNSKGPSRVTPVEVVGWSGEDKPLLAPTNFSLVEIVASDAAIFSWDPVPPESLRGHFLGYKIQAWTNDTEIREHVFQHDRNAGFIRVEPSKKNYVRIMAYNGANNGPPSETISFLTPQGTPGPVKSFNVYPLSNFAMILNWEKPEALNGILTGYKVYYAKITQTQVGPTLEMGKIIDPTSTKAKLSNLFPGTKYRIWIHAMTAAGQGEGVFVDETSRNEVAAEPDESHFEASKLSDNKTFSMRVRWLPVLDGHAHPGTQFQVSYRLKGHSQWTHSPMELENDYVVITDLEPRVYEVKVTSYDGDYSKDSEIDEVNLA